MRLQVTKQRGLWWAISSLVVLAGIVAMVINWTQIGAPIRPSLDFIGGTRLQFELDCSKPDNCDRRIDEEGVRNILNQQGLGDSSLQVLSQTRNGRTEYGLSIRTKPLDVEKRTQLINALNQFREFDPRKTLIDSVGPTLGQQIFTQGLVALLVSFAGITIYLSFRFQWDYAFFAFVALFHDVLITVGSFGILSLITGLEVDSLFIVALLTIIGFSVNDTVVIYDRIREVTTEEPEESINQIVDDAVNQTLTRSINTTLTVLLTLTSIYLFGGETLKNFALALIIGFAAGAYSSIFIASTLLAWWRERQPKPQMAATAASDESP